MLKTIAGWAGGRRAKWFVVGIWLVLLVLSQLPGKLTDATEDRIASFLPSDSAAIVADKVIEDRFPGGQTTSSVAVYHRAGGLTDADKQTIAAEAQKIAKVKGVLPPVVPFSSGAPEGLVSRDGGTAFTVIPINAKTQQAINDVTDNVRESSTAEPGSRHRSRAQPRSKPTCATGSSRRTSPCCSSPACSCWCCCWRSTARRSWP